MTEIDTAALRAAAENPIRMTTFDGHVARWVSVEPDALIALLDRIDDLEANAYRDGYGDGYADAAGETEVGR